MGPTCPSPHPQQPGRAGRRPVLGKSALRYGYAERGRRPRLGALLVVEADAGQRGSGRVAAPALQRASGHPGARGAGDGLAQLPSREAPDFHLHGAPGPEVESSSLLAVRAVAAAAIRLGPTPPTPPASPAIAPGGGEAQSHRADRRPSRQPLRPLRSGSRTAPRAATQRCPVAAPGPPGAEQRRDRGAAAGRPTAPGRRRPRPRADCPVVAGSRTSDKGEVQERDAAGNGTEPHSDRGRWTTERQAPGRRDGEQRGRGGLGSSQGGPRPGGHH